MALDFFKRPLQDLRISVTDRCNLRCTYCMPFDEYEWVERQELLTYEEITRLAGVFAGLGVEKVRLTGGEPLLRKDLDVLVRELGAVSGLQDITLTTNGTLLAEQAEALKSAGLQRINVSLDTLDPKKFERIRQRGDLSKVLDGLRAARRCGFHPIKINAVIEQGVNENEVVPLAEFARENRFTLRLIEFMDVGNANQWRVDKVVSKKEILAAINARFPLREAARKDASAPAVDYEFLDGQGEIGVIASVTEPFCRDCTRARLTADGKLVTCLFSGAGHDLKGLLRHGAADDELAQAIAAVWQKRSDRYSEERFVALQSGAGYKARGRRKMEMIVLGG